MIRETVANGWYPAATPSALDWCAVGASCEALAELDAGLVATTIIGGEVAAAR
jgi:hypothetical protein